MFYTAWVLFLQTPTSKPSVDSRYHRSLFVFVNPAVCLFCSPDISTPSREWNQVSEFAANRCQINPHFNSSIVISCAGGQKASTHMQACTSPARRSIQTHGETWKHSCTDTQACKDSALTPHVPNKSCNTDTSAHTNAMKTSSTYNILILNTNPPRFSWYADIT